MRSAGSKIILAVLHINNAVPVVRIEHPLLGRIALNRTGRRPPASVKPLLSSVLGLLSTHRIPPLLADGEMQIGYT